MTEEKGFYESDQRVKDSQTNIEEANAPTFSGNVGIVNVLPQENTPVPRLPFVPDPPSDFAGRDDELNELKAKFAAGTNIISLRGIGGVGKTALAFKLVELLRDSYPDGQIMVDMRGTSDNPVSPPEAMGSVIHAYNPAEELPDNEAAVKEMYLHLLRGKRSLLLLDNVQDDKQILSMIPPKSCGLLITSRKTIKLPGLFRKNIDVLKPDAALRLMQKIYSSTSDSVELIKADPAWFEIARLCGSLPLALRAAASYLANSEDISPKKYAEELRNESTRLETIGEEGVEISVDASFKLSYIRLNAGMQQIFQNLSVFPADFDGKAEEIICQDEEHKHLSELVRWSLVDYQRLGEIGEGRYSLHDLVRLFAAKCPQSEDDKIGRNLAKQRHAEYYKEILSCCDRLYMKGKGESLVGLRLLNQEWDNIKVGHLWAEKNAERNAIATNLCCAYPDAGIRVLDLKQHPRDRISWSDVGLVAARLQKDPKLEGVHLGILGRAYLGLGETQKAIGYLEQSLAISREIGNRNGEGSALGSLGQAYSDLGDMQKAIKYIEKSLDIPLETGNRHGVSSALDALGRAYSSIGEPKKSIEYIKQSLIISREIGDRRGESSSLGSLGRIYYNLGKPKKAIGYFEQSLAISREIGNRKGEGSALGSLGRVHSDLGEPKKAIEYLGQSLAISHEIGNRKGESINLSGLGRVYSNLGESKKAAEYFEQSLAISQEIGNLRRESADLGSLGRMYSEVGMPQKAIEYLKRALNISQKTWDRRGESANLSSLGRVYFSLDEQQKAIEYFEKALLISQETGNRDGESANLSSLGRVYSRLGEQQEAIMCFKKALTISQETEDRRGEGTCLGDLGRIFYKIGDMEKAIEYLEQALDISREIEDRRGEGACLGSLGRTYVKKCNMQKAIEYIEQALEISRRTGDRRGEGACLGDLGRIFYRIGDMQKAIECLEQALGISRKIGNRRGEEAALHGLGEAYADLGEAARAMEYFERAWAFARRDKNSKIYD